MTLTSRAPDAARTAVVRCATLGSLTLVLAVAGCTSTPDPAPSPTVTGAVSTPTPAPTPTSTASPKPERPAAMDDVTVEGAIAAATYFISLYPYVYNTGDLTEWNTLSHPECIFCASVIDNVQAQVGQGLRGEGGQITITASTGVELDPGHSFGADLEVTQGPSGQIDASGSPVGDPYPAESFRMVFSMLFEEGAWRVREAETVTPDA